MHQCNQQLWHYLSRQRHLSFMKTFCCSCSRTAFVTKSDTNTGCYNKKAVPAASPFNPNHPTPAALRHKKPGSCSCSCARTNQQPLLLFALLRTRIRPLTAPSPAAAASALGWCILRLLLVLRARPQLLQLRVMRPPQLLLHLLYLLLTPPQLLMLRVRPRTALSPAAAASALIAVYATSSAGAAASALAAAFFLLFLLIFRLVASSCSNSGSST
jgi:hypothetical protein